MNLASVDPATKIAQATPEQRTKEFRDALKATPAMKKTYAEIAKKYLEDPNPDVKAAAQELVNTTQQ
jgi:GrpB-like predicted nucleotidyltransferase (UPF0157 family)